MCSFVWYFVDFAFLLDFSFLLLKNCFLMESRREALCGSPCASFNNFFNIVLQHLSSSGFSGLPSDIW